MRRLRIILASALCVVASSAVPVPAAAQSGALIKGPLPAVYYVDEGKRYVFPNERVFFSWYGGFETVQTVSEAELASYPIGGNVTYKPASKLVKIQSDPRVYAVGAGGRLRWITSEAAASALYGPDWNRKVDDIPDAFFSDYKEGEPVASAADFEMATESAVDAIAADLALRSGVAPVQEFIAVKSGAWSDASVWGGKRPGTGARVTIPVGVKVSYDMTDAPSLKSLDVLGTLDFMTDRATRLAARQITVRGTMTAGTVDAPVPAGKSVTIMLTGAADSAVADDGLTVDGGALSLHGAPVGASWATLAGASEAGDAKLVLAQEVSWPVGAEVAVIGARDGSRHEVRTIAAVSEGHALTLDAPLDDAHRSEPGLRTEVVLLDRNVSIIGVGEGLGSYVRGINRARIDVSFVALEKLGRKGVFGQYPLYLDGLTAPAVRDSVIRSAGNRCIVLRQTTEAAIGRNAAFSAYGSCFATEDGSETGNVFSGNLAADIRGGALPGDAAPAGFRIRHPGNVLRDNMVAASAGFGYWYDLPESAAKNSGVILKPREAALGAFERNGVRGARKSGLYVDDDRGRMNYLPDDRAVFSGLAAVMNGEYGFWMRGAGLEVRDAFLAENGVGGSFAAFGATVRNATFEGSLAGSGDAEGARVGFLFDDGPVSLLDVVFRRFKGDSSAYGLREGNPHVPDPRSSFRRATYEGDVRLWSAASPSTAGDKMSVVRDADSGETLAAKSAFLDVDCAMSGSDPVMRCPRVYAQLSLALRESPLNRPVTFTNLANGGSVTLEPGTAFDGEYAYANVAEGGSYKASIPNVPSVRVEYDGFTLPLLVRLPAGLGAAVRKDGSALARVELAELAPGGWSYDAETSEAVLWLNPGDAFDLIR